MEYIALVHREGERFVSVVPDLNDISSFGNSFEEAIQKTKEAAELYCEGLNKLPKPSTYDSLVKKSRIEPHVNALLIDLKVEKMIRINIMITSDLLQAADKKAALSFGGNRSAYIQHLVSQDNQ